MPSYTLPGGTIKFESEKTNGRYQALVSSGGSVTTALSGENADMSYSMTGAATGDTLTLTAKGATDFGSVGPIFVMLLDAEQKDGSGNLIPRFGTGSSDISTTTVSKFESNSAMPGGEGWRMGADDSNFGSTTYPFQFNVDTPQHKKGFESFVTHLPVHKRIPIRDALIATTEGDDWGVKPLWNMSQSGAFGGPEDPGYNFFLATMYGWLPDFDYWGQDIVLSGNTSQGNPTFYPSFNSDLNDTDNVDSPNRYWRPEPHTIEFGYDAGGDDPTVYDSEMAIKVWTPADGKIVDEVVSNTNLKNQTESTTTPWGHFTYPGYVRGWNIGLDYNYVENQRYKAVGDGRYCRVVISDNPDPFATERKITLEVSDQSDWTSPQIQARFGGGGYFDLANMAGNYFCVIGINNTLISSVQIVGA